MLKNENIICISSIDWDFVWQGHQEVMSTFAKNGNRVLFIENTGIRPPTLKDIPRLQKRIINWFKSTKGFRAVRENLYVYSPLCLPFPYSRIARCINRFLMLKAINNWMRAMKFASPIAWTFLPTGIAIDIIHSVNPKILVYYYIADFDRLTNNYRSLKKTEEILIKECDVIFVQGEYFLKRCAKFNKEAFIFPFGVNTDVFEVFIKDSSSYIPEDIQDIKHPIIGYVGGVHRHIDFELLKKLALSHPDWSIVLIGPVQIPDLEMSAFKNIYLLGKKEFEQLPAYINQFDVGIVPYLITDYTNTVYPTKINEYHILGKPTVSTRLPEVIKSDENKLIYFAHDGEDFIKKTEEALINNSDRLIQLRISSSRNDSWSKRIEEMSAKVEEAICKKEAEIPHAWQVRFIELYKNSKRGLIKFGIAIFLVWLTVFYTPLVWHIAEPLKIAQDPQVSDAIVVFAGGVGESGQAGQGYEERVGYAVDLYKKGYAKKLIFSSGMRGTFSEPYIMKALAVSLSIPSDAIILEDKAANTYENVKFSDGILYNHKLSKIILVSSPYHMLRSSLVFKKAAPQLRVIYSPVPYSLFYEHGEVNKLGKKRLRQISLRQIKAILHEYLAICYYWWKGYI